MDVLKIENVVKIFGDYAAVNDVSFGVGPGRIFGILGPNGAGKTTMIRMITNIYMPDKGKITIFDKPVGPAHQNRIGYLPEERGLYKKIKVIDQLSYFGQLKGLSKKEAVSRAREWLKNMDASDWETKKIQELSKGMQQKIQFISTILHDPEILILDEPFSGFDPINVNIIKDEILNLAEQGSTIIFSTHRMESVEELCDHILLINKSEKILEGSKQKIKEDYKTHTFDVEHKNLMGEIADGFEIKNQEQLEDGFYKTSIKIVNGMGPNELLKNLIDKVEVHSFVEKIPSMNQIFISTVQGGDYE